MHFGKCWFVSLPASQTALKWQWQLGNGIWHLPLHLWAWKMFLLAMANLFPKKSYLRMDLCCQKNGLLPFYDLPGTPAASCQLSCSLGSHWAIFQPCHFSTAARTRTWEKCKIAILVSDQVIVELYNFCQTLLPIGFRRATFFSVGGPGRVAHHRKRLLNVHKSHIHTPLYSTGFGRNDAAKSAQKVTFIWTHTYILKK